MFLFSDYSLHVTLVGVRILRQNTVLKNCLQAQMLWQLTREKLYTEEVQVMNNQVGVLTFES